MEKKTKGGDKKPSGQNPKQIQETPSGDEWDCDLTEDRTTEKQSSLRAELYLKACRQIGAVPVSRFLRNLDSSILNLNYYGVGPLGAKALAVALKNDCVITHLELEDNDLYTEGTYYLMKMLQENATIQSLNLSNNHLGLKAADIISKMLSKNYRVTSLKLSGNDFEDSAAKCLSEALQGDYVVQELDLSNNSFCEAGGELLGQMLGSNMGIEVLNLSWNNLRLGGAAALGAGLKANSTLRQLQLSHCGFGQMEAECLGQALKQNNTLVLLDLSCNCIDDQALAPLCQALNTNCTLGVLKLSKNLITNFGALTLLRTIKANLNSAVEEIDISNVFVCETFMELLTEVHHQRPSLKVEYSVLTSVTRNMSALHTFKTFLQERNENLVNFFQALDGDKTLTVSTSDFRNAVKEAKAPLDEQQLDWLIRKFDMNCTATIKYRCLQKAASLVGFSPSLELNLISALELLTPTSCINLSAATSDLSRATRPSASFSPSPKQSSVQTELFRHLCRFWQRNKDVH